MNTIQLKTNGNLNNYTCTNPKGQSITIGNDGTSVGPMESLLMAMAGCSTIDIVLILQKMKQEIKDIEVKVEGERADDHPKVYNSIKAHYTIYGNVKESKAAEAIRLSVEKYCSVAKMLDKSAEIKTSFEVKSE